MYCLIKTTSSKWCLESFTDTVKGESFKALILLAVSMQHRLDMCNEGRTHKGS